MYINILLTIVVIAAMLLIYTTYRTDKEDYFILKLLGYYFLGAFRFNFNHIAIPLGFLIYAIFLKPNINRTAKRLAALLGLVIFISGLLIPSISKAYFERDRQIPASSNNLYKMDFNRDWANIKIGRASCRERV